MGIMVVVDQVDQVDLEIIHQFLVLQEDQHQTTQDHQHQADLDKVVMVLQILAQVVVVLLVVLHHQVQDLLQVAVDLEW
jgi:hypothetical protein